MGLAFKPRTDDVRDAPSLALIDALLADGVRLRVHDPEASANIRRLLRRPFDLLRPAVWRFGRSGRLGHRDRMAGVPQSGLRGDAPLLREHVLFDGRNLYDPKIPASHGFIYHSIGRKTSRPE